MNYHGHITTLDYVVMVFPLIAIAVAGIIGAIIEHYFDN